MSVRAGKFSLRKNMKVQLKEEPFNKIKNWKHISIQSIVVCDFHTLVEALRARPTTVPSKITPVIYKMYESPAEMTFHTHTHNGFLWSTQINLYFSLLQKPPQWLDWQQAGRQAGRDEHPLINRFLYSQLNLPFPRLAVLVCRGLAFVCWDVPFLPTVLVVFLVAEAPSFCLVVVPVPTAGLADAGAAALCCFLAWASRGRAWFARPGCLVSHLSEQIRASRKERGSQGRLEEKVEARLAMLICANKCTNGHAVKQKWEIREQKRPLCLLF